MSAKPLHGERTSKTHRILVTLFHAGEAMNGQMIADSLGGADVTYVFERLRYMASKNLVVSRQANRQRYFLLTQRGMDVGRLISSHAPVDVEYLSLNALIAIVSMPNHRPDQPVRLPRKADLFGQSADS
jgi:hypothetical protein